MKSTWRIVTAILIFWLFILIYMSANLYQSSDVTENAERQLTRAMKELDDLREQNKKLYSLAEELRHLKEIAQKGGKNCEELQSRLDDANSKLKSVGAKETESEKLSLTDFSPSSEMEKSRRKIENGVQEMWFFLRSQLGKLKESLGKDSPINQKVDKILENGADHSRTIQTDLHRLYESEPMATWRKKEAEDLSDIIQRRLFYLQNPSDCSAAKKLICNINKGCGYGCQLHHLVYCFMIAFGTKRTLILESHGWRYSPGGWETVFQPISRTCKSPGSDMRRMWGPPEVIENVKVVELPIVDSLRPRPPFLPQVVPLDLAERLDRLHGSPGVWFVGQFMKYLLKPNSDLLKEIEKAENRLDFKGPIVGVHVRRTDKIGTEASFHSIEEYMYHVEDYYKYLEKQNKDIGKKRIYLATDDPELLSEATMKYPNYVFVSDVDFSKTASMGTRYSHASLIAVILDIHFLSKSDFLVCTFSSQVCRVAYEIMQTLHPDASARFRSLDDIYYYGGQNAHNQVAIANHQAQDGEIELRVGDTIGIAGNHWDGYSKGLNRRSSRTGLYPSYKVAEKLVVAKFPTLGVESRKTVDKQ
ncbi:DgyrCDS9898 [Dimorphilus gyrociliatus]|nr:DgyrCDS9898 [Dimorphilus gyrociliatus]